MINDKNNKGNNMKMHLKLLVFYLFPTTMIFAYDAFSIGLSGVENTLQSATFYNNRLLYGLDFVHFGMDINSEESDVGLSVNIFMPRLGFRIPIKSMNRINTYNQIEGYIIIPMVKGKGDLEDAIDEVDEEIKDALTLMGFKVSHAVDYEFNHQLSLTASVGLNWVFWDFTQEEEYGESSKTKLSANLSYTYTMIALHYKLGSN